MSTRNSRAGHYSMWLQGRQGAGAFSPARLERALEAEACLNLLELDLVFDVRLHLLCVGTFELLSCCCLQRQARRPVSLYGAVR